MKKIALKNAARGTAFLTMARPKPVPPILRLRPLSTR